jgi:hypothetical protein
MALCVYYALLIYTDQILLYYLDTKHMVRRTSEKREMYKGQDRREKCKLNIKENERNTRDIK